MTNRTRHYCDALASALRKAQPNGGRELCGSLTPMEILALVEVGGVRYNPSQDSTVTRAQELKDEGLATSQWFYFQFPKEKRP